MAIHRVIAPLLTFDKQGRATIQSEEKKTAEKNVPKMRQRNQNPIDS